MNFLTKKHRRMKSAAVTGKLILVTAKNLDGKKQVNSLNLNQ